MRKLKFPDAFAFARTIKQIGVKEEIKKAIEGRDKEASAESVGIDILWTIFDKATEKKAEKEIYNFFAGPFEMTAEEVENLDLPELIILLKRLAAENNLTDFFKSAAALTK